jgi:hypothetical protein
MPRWLLPLGPKASTSPPDLADQRLRTLPSNVERDVHHSLRVYAQQIGNATADVVGRLSRSI